MFPKVGRTVADAEPTIGITVIFVRANEPLQRAARPRQKRGSPLDYSCEDLDTLVVPLPDKLFLTAEKAEVIITDLLEALGPVKMRAAQKGLVRRLYCTSSKNYRTFRLRDTDDVSAELLRHPLPHFVWVGELSLLSRWNQAGPSGVVEIGIDATAGPYDEAAFLWIRYPGIFVLNLNRIYGYKSGKTPTVVYEVTDTSLTFSSFDGNLRRFT
jgi:hypothetical protein